AAPSARTTPRSSPSSKASRVHVDARLAGGNRRVRREAQAGVSRRGALGEGFLPFLAPQAVGAGVPEICLAHPEIAPLDLHPLIAKAEGCAILDARVLVA